MKRVQAVIRPEKFDDVQEALEAAGFAGFMVYDIRGHGTEGTPSGEYRGVAFTMSVRHKLLLDILVDDEEVEPVCAAIKAAASEGKPGDGMIMLLDVAGVIPFR